jgi:multiple sugar transport system permease protein
MSFRRTVKNPTLYMYFVVAVFSLILIFPIIWTFITSLKSLETIFGNPLSPKPSYFLHNYIRVFGDRPFLLYARNSLLVTIPTVAIVITLSSLAAYCFSRFRFRGRKLFFVLVIATRLFPPISLLVPWYMLGDTFNLLDTHLILILTGVYLDLPIAIWLLTGFFDDLPRDFDEAGLIDGCSRITVFYYILVPCIAPAIAAVSIMVFLFSWNEYLLPAITTFTSAARTLPVGVVEFVADAFVEWNLLCAGAIITSLPALLFVILFQQYIVRGLIAGGVKG